LKSKFRQKSRSLRETLRKNRLAPNVPSKKKVPFKGARRKRNAELLAETSQG